MHSWKVNWDSKIEEVDDYSPSKDTDSSQSVKPSSLTLQDYLYNAFLVKKEIFIGDTPIEEEHISDEKLPDGSVIRLTPIADPDIISLESTLLDDRVYNQSENSYEAAVQGAFEQFRSSPFFKRDPKSEYDRVLGQAFEENTTIYSPLGQIPTITKELDEETKRVEEKRKNLILEKQQAIQFRGTVIQDLIADFKEYVEAIENKGQTEAEALQSIASKSIAFQMGLVFKLDTPSGEIPSWLEDAINLATIVNASANAQNSLSAR